jgi:hypothetical protein
VGVVKDIPPHLLPPEAWTDARNIRFQDNKALKFDGHRAVFDPPGVAPYWALGVPTAASYFILYAGLAKVRTIEGVTHSDITRASGDYTGAATDKWNGGVLAGIPVFTNGVDDPQSWSPVAAATALVDLPNWPADHQCKVIVPFKNFLVALHITKSSTVSPHMVRTSHPADPGSVPVSWDETDATKDVTEFELTDSQAGVIQDALVLGDILIIYKDNSTWGLQHTGGFGIFRSFKIFDETGILTQRCVALTPKGDRHFVMTGDDIIIHSGNRASIQSVIDSRWKKFINATLDTDNFGRSFVARNRRLSEMWFCYPETGSTLPTLAIVWNSVTGAIGVRELSDLNFIANTVIKDTGIADPTWDADSESWDSDATKWGQREFFPQGIDMLGVDATNTKLFQIDNTNQFNSVNMTVLLEREGIALIGQDRQGNPKADPTVRKLFKRIWIKAEGSPFNVSLGKQEEIDGAIEYAPSQVFTPGVDKYLDFTVNGPLGAVKFESSADVAWQLHGYELDIEALGEH